MASRSPEVLADPFAALDGPDALRPLLRVTEHRDLTRAVSGIAANVEHRLVQRHHLDRDQASVRIQLEMMRSAEAGELMRRLVGAMLQELVDAEATAFIGARPHQRTAAPCASAAGRAPARSGLNARGRSDQEPTPNAWPPPVCGTAAMTHGSRDGNAVMTLTPREDRGNLPA